MTLWRTLLLSVAFVVVAADDQPFRKFFAKLNLDCVDPICSQTVPSLIVSNVTRPYYKQLPNLLYLHGALVSSPDGINDTLHVVFSTFGGFPSILFVHCKASNDDLIFKWDILLDDTKINKAGGIVQPASCKNTTSYSLVAVSLVDFNDAGDTAVLDVNAVDSLNSSKVVPMDTFYWTRVANTSDPSVFLVQSDAMIDNGTYFANNGTVTLRLVIGEVASSRPDQLPHLQFSGNSVQLDTVVDDWISLYKNTRLAVELILISNIFESSVSTVSDAKWYTTQSIDDEYTPGTFTLTDWITAGSLYETLKTAPTTSLDYDNAYVQYKPIAYTVQDSYTVDTTVSVSATALNTKQIDLYCSNPNIRKALQTSVVAAFFGFPTFNCSFNGNIDNTSSTYTFSAVNVTFGQVGDGFYRKTKWVKWTAQAGFGVPPQDSVSALVITIIIVGLGIPIVLIAAGGVFFGYRKWRSKGVIYDRIN